MAQQDPQQQAARAVEPMRGQESGTDPDPANGLSPEAGPGPADGDPQATAMSGDPGLDPSERIVARGTTRTPPPPVDLNKPDEPRPPGRTDLIGHGLVWLSEWSLRLLLVAAAAVLIVVVIGKLWVIVLPLFLALLLSTVLGPPTGFLRRQGVTGAVASLLVILTAVALLVGIVAAIAPSVKGQGAKVVEGVNGGLQDIQDRLADPPLNLSETQLSAALGAAQERVSGNASNIASGVFAGLGAATSALVTTVLVLVLTFFMLKDGARFIPWLDAVVGRAAGRHLTLVLRRCYATLGSFIRTQLVVSLIDATFIGAGLLILEVPLALPLTVLTFFGGFVPIVGAFFAGSVAVLVTLVASGATSALIVLGLIVLVQQLEGNVLSPTLQGRSLSLHPAVVILAVTAGSTLFGVVGAFLAVPTVAVLAQGLRYLDELADATAAAATVSMTATAERRRSLARLWVRPEAVPGTDTDAGSAPKDVGDGSAATPSGVAVPAWVPARVRRLLPQRSGSESGVRRAPRPWDRLRR